MKISLFADDHFTLHVALIAALVTRVEVVGRRHVVIESRRVIAIRFVEGLLVLIGAGADERRVLLHFRETREHRILKRAIGRRVVVERETRQREIGGGPDRTRIDGGAAALEDVGIDECEQRVANDREAGGESVRTPRVVGLRQIEIAALVPRIVLKVSVQLAVEIVRPRLRLHEDDRAVAAAEFRAVAVRENLKRLNRRERDALSMLVLRRVIVVHAVDLERRAARAGAVEHDRRACGESGVVSGDAGAVPCACGHDTSTSTRAMTLSAAVRKRLQLYV